MCIRDRPYTYNWQGPNDYSVTATPGGNAYYLNGLFFQDSSPLSNPGNYTLTVTDSDGAQVQFSTVANSTNYPLA